MRKPDVATALAQLDRATDRAVPLRREPGRLANQRFVERPLAGDLVDEPDHGEGLGPVRLPITLGRNGQAGQRLLHLPQQGDGRDPGTGAERGQQQVRGAHAIARAERRAFIRRCSVSPIIRQLESKALPRPLGLRHHVWSLGAGRAGPLSVMFGSFGVLLRFEDRRKVSYGSISRGQGSQAETMLNRCQDGGRVVRNMVDHEVGLQERRDDQRRDPCARAPLVRHTVGAVLARRRHVVPLAAELVVGDNDHGVRSTGAALNRPEQLNEVIAAPGLAGIAGMLVFEPDRLYEADGIQLAGAG